MCLGDPARRDIPWDGRWGLFFRMSKSHPGKQLAKEEKAKSGQQIGSSLDVLGPRGLLPRLCCREMAVGEEFGVPFGQGCALPVGKLRARS